MPDSGAELGRRKIANAVSVAPDAVATANPGHPRELVDASIRGVDPIRAARWSLPDRP
jgi:hypothetical protein